MQEISGAADIVPKMQAGYESIEQQLITYIENVRSDNHALRQETEANNFRLADMEDEIRALDERLGGATAERAALVQRLEAEARVKEQFQQVEKLFGRSEARVFREGDTLLPILARSPEDERQRLSSFGEVQVTGLLSVETVPLSQVTESFDIETEDPLIWRKNRRRLITLQCSPRDTTFPTLHASVLPQFDAIELPPGYNLEWGGEYDSTQDAVRYLMPGLAPAFLIIALIIVALFNALRPLILIFTVIPFALIGIVAGLLVTGAPWGFMALLGGMSLAGMMIKNAIVLLDQINIEKASGKEVYQAVVDASVSRLSAVLLAAATTILGMMPLLQDPFWVSMAVTIMAGLFVGSVLTMVLLPVLYCCLYRVEPA